MLDSNTHNPHPKLAKMHTTTFSAHTKYKELIHYHTLKPLKNFLKIFHSRPILNFIHFAQLFLHIPQLFTLVDLPIYSLSFLCICVRICSYSELYAAFAQAGATE